MTGLLQCHVSATILAHTYVQPEHEYSVVMNQLSVRCLTALQFYMSFRQVTAPFALSITQHHLHWISLRFNCAHCSLLCPHEAD